jgi:hypothetical protein
MSFYGTTKYSRESLPVVKSLNNNPSHNNIVCVKHSQICHENANNSTGILAK